MKTKFLIIPLLASLFMMGCTQENIAPDGGKDVINGNGEVNRGYMAVNLVNTDGEGTRAAQAGFEDGTPEENNITAVRFYFFNAAGGIVHVKKDDTGKQVNYFDWTPGEMEKDKPGDQIEKRYKAVIVISTKDGDEIPQKIAAVMNPTKFLKDKGNQSLSNLQEITNDYASQDFTTSGKFVMYNSVYSEGGIQVVDAVSIKDGNIAKTEELAKQNPLKIYVERNVAKISVNINISEYSKETKLLPLKYTETDNAITVPSVEDDGTMVSVYLKLDKWGLTSETTKGNLVKEINPKWDMNWVQSPSNPYRSCWAINAPDANNKYYKYTETNTDFEGKYLYTNENAQHTNTSGVELPAKYYTKVMITGQLCTQEGIPVSLCRHMGALFIDTYNPKDESKNLPKLKKSILSQLDAAGYKYFTKAGETYTQIDVADLKIEIVEQNPVEDVNHKGKNCYVIAQLTDAAKAKKWYKLNTTDLENYTYDELKNSDGINSPDEINNNLKNKDVVDPALVWAEGRTYYYYEIMHNKEAGQPGVVRNHIYKTTITGIKGLGTPVYDPEQTIIPEKPDDNDHYVAAEINILSWHVVSNDYNLEW